MTDCSGRILGAWSAHIPYVSTVKRLMEEATRYLQGNPGRSGGFVLTSEENKKGRIYRRVSTMDLVLDGIMGDI